MVWHLSCAADLRVNHPLEHLKDPEQEADAEAAVDQEVQLFAADLRNDRGQRTMQIT